MAVDTEQQTVARGPAQPSYVFRGHTAQIHSVRITRRNTCLLTGDADGWLVVWKLETKRPLAVWRPHQGAILGMAEWGDERLITHGRDNALRVWQFNTTDTSIFSTVLPADASDASTTHHSKPWLLHSLPVNTLNFCPFSMCYHHYMPAKGPLSTLNTSPILIAVPAVDDKKVDIYRLPDEKLAYVVARIEPKDTGMVMTVKLVHHEPSNNVLVAVGYEAGLVAVHLLPQLAARQTQPPNSIHIAQIIYLSQPHSQPVLGLDAAPDGSTFYTSSADAIIAVHRMPELPPNHTEALPQWENPTSAEHQEITTYPKQGRTSSPKQDQSTIPPPPPTLETLDFSKQSLSSTPPKPAAPAAGLSSLFSSATLSSLPPTPHTPSPSPSSTLQPPHKLINTHHSGQQSLTVRSDGRLLVTGGWDSRIRIYSAKSLKEMAVLKWHKQGVYAVDFGLILGDDDVSKGEDGDEEGGKEVMPSERGLGRLQRLREEQMQRRHWVVAGAKDGKVSLWEIF